MYPPVDPVLIQIGPLSVRWYGLLVIGAVILGAWIASKYVARKGEDANHVWDGLLWVLIPALVGARLYYVFIQSPRGPDGFDRYMTNPLEILNIGAGGLHIFGGFLFGAAAVWIYARRHKLPILVYLDGVALALPLSQAVARWANFINQELYGPPTTLPWGLRIDPEHRIPPYNDLTVYPESVRFHPLFLYESIWNFIGFGVLWLVARRFASRLRDGDLLLLYMIWYPSGRFLIEFLRTDSWFFPGTPFNVVHVLSAAVVIASAALFITRHRIAKPAEAPPSPSSTTL
ncbi:MAG: prolipoprotein diacylglyceryl transferase [Anaerolineae bacterium]|nr:prolipoprotein diacylglyceryl transferase [Thermoflexales bacterium]MDW8408759.1 prolipoprotein diacylglyceryl transferase [Anaerolineae bacterium]